MSWGRIAAALGLSLSLHLVGLGLIRGRAPAAGVAEEPRSTSEVPLTILGGGGAPRSEPGGAASHARQVSSVGPTRGARFPTSVRLRGGEVGGLVEPPAGGLLAMAGDEPIAPGDPAGNGDPAVPGAGDDVSGNAEGTGLGFGTGNSIDLQPFVDRLRRSAERCGSAPPRVSKEHRGRAQVGLVRFCVAPDGEPTAVSLVESTGDRSLDRAALECIVPGAAPLPPADRCLVVPLRFH